jgi:hypothetical protein
MDITDERLDDFLRVLKSAKNNMFEYNRIFYYDAKDYTIPHTEYNQMVLALDRRGLIKVYKSSDSTTFSLDLNEVRKFKGFVQENKEHNESTQKIEEYRNLEIENLKLSIKQNKNSRKISILGLCIAIFAVLVPFAQWIYDNNYSSDIQPRKLKEQIAQQQLKLDSIERLLKNHYPNTDSTTIKMK